MLAGRFMLTPALANGRHARKKSTKRCKNQKAECHAAVTGYCAPQADPLACENTLLPCCARLTGCDVGSTIACIFATFLDPD